MNRKELAEMAIKTAAAEGPAAAARAVCSRAIEEGLAPDVPGLMAEVEQAIADYGVGCCSSEADLADVLGEVFAEVGTDAYAYLYGGSYRGGLAAVRRADNDGTSIWTIVLPDGSAVIGPCVIPDYLDAIGEPDCEGEPLTITVRSYPGWPEVPVAEFADALSALGWAVTITQEEAADAQG